MFHIVHFSLTTQKVLECKPVSGRDRNGYPIYNDVDRMWFVDRGSADRVCSALNDIAYTHCFQVEYVYLG
jgi:hypothetical protein